MRRIAYFTGGGPLDGGHGPISGSSVTAEAPTTVEGRVHRYMYVGLYMGDDRLVGYESAEFRYVGIEDAELERAEGSS